MQDPAFKAMTEQLQGMQGMGPGGLFPEPGTSGSEATGGTEAQAEEFQSAALRGLYQQTQKTVAQQAKHTRGVAAPGQKHAGSGAGLGPGAGGAPRAGGLGELLAGLGSLGGGGGLPGMGLGGGANGAGGNNFMVDYIMQNLLSKDVLYAPLKVGRGAVAAGGIGFRDQLWV